jgi:hypothetical protein
MIRSNVVIKHTVVLVNNKKSIWKVSIGQTKESTVRK